jgi:riboflavin kinase/FMN adenylyltransferase
VQFFSSLDEVPKDFGPSAVTIGKFDGVHIGHRRVLDALQAIAAERGLVSTVVTFDRNPAALLTPERLPDYVASNDQKRELLAATGVAATLMVPFTRDFAALEPERFVDDILVRALHAEVVLVGDDFRFGSRGRGDVALLAELGKKDGFIVQSIDAVVGDGGAPVSSTMVRSLLAAGEVRDAAALLGRAPSVRGVVVHGEERGRALGYPTANLSSEHEGLIPADGVYAARLVVGDTTYPAAVSVGNNPTFEGVPDKRVEAHVVQDRSMDADLDLYGKTVTVEFVEFVRGMVKFDGVDALVAQMTLDEARIREILGVTTR